jgi:cold-inducible RNA-binding protein
MKLFVGNLAFDVTDSDLRAAFEPFGEVVSASIVKERFGSDSRGFGFVEMPSSTEAQAAINELNGKEFKGRNMNVNEARPMAPRQGGDRGGFSSHRPDSRRRDGSKRRSDGKHERKRGFGKRPY